jgi:hypothetical protein
MTDIYKICSCCGKYYIESNAANKAEFCSTVCEEVFIQCAVCGNYYKLDEFLLPKELICSKECTRKFKFKNTADNYKFDFSNL